MLAKLKKCTLMQEGQRKREKTQKDVIQRDCHGRTRTAGTSGMQEMSPLYPAGCQLCAFFFILYYACVIILYLWVWWAALLALVPLPSLHPHLCHSFITCKLYLPIPWFGHGHLSCLNEQQCVPRVLVDTPSLALRGLIDCSLVPLPLHWETHVPSCPLVQEGWETCTTDLDPQTDSVKYGPSLLGPHLNKSVLGTCLSQAQPTPEGSHSTCTLHDKW